MSVLAVFAFSETSVAARLRVARWMAALLFPVAPVQVPSGRPRLLRDAGIMCAVADVAREQRSMREMVYRSHWLT